VFALLIVVGLDAFVDVLVQRSAIDLTYDAAKGRLELVPDPALMFLFFQMVIAVVLCRCIRLISFEAACLHAKR